MYEKDNCYLDGVNRLFSVRDFFLNGQINYYYSANNSYKFKCF